jgi:hypothetical protein
MAGGGTVAVDMVGECTARGVGRSQIGRYNVARGWRKAGSGCRGWNLELPCLE